MQLQHEILKRFFATPAMKKIAADIATERETEREQLSARLAKLTSERDSEIKKNQGLVDAAKARHDAAIKDWQDAQVAVRVADGTYGTAKGLHRVEIRRLEQELQTLEAAATGAGA